MVYKEAFRSDLAKNPLDKLKVVHSMGKALKRDVGADRTEIIKRVLLTAADAIKGRRGAGRGGAVVDLEANSLVTYYEAEVLAGRPDMEPVRIAQRMKEEEIDHKTILSVTHGDNIELLDIKR